MIHDTKRYRPETLNLCDVLRDDGINLLNDYKRIPLSLSTGRDADGKRVHDDLIEALDQIDWFSALKDTAWATCTKVSWKRTSETKFGAGQYFTPRALIPVPRVSLIVSG